MATALIRDLYNIKPEHKGGVITIGNFDGVHIGHNVLINKLKERAKALHTHSIVMTFEPQPLEYFAREKGVARLTRWREKFCALAETGVDYVLVVRFNQKLADLSATDFVKNILVDQLAVEHVLVGDDFHFGHNREGNFEFLERAGKDAGFTVENISSVLVDGERVSSTRIRQALAQGNHDLLHLLGHPYTMMGRVVHGDKLGRALGFPTANIHLHRPITPVQGIYIVRMHGIENHGLPGVANVGIRPTIGGTRSLLEVYLFNFDRDIYGQYVSVEFCQKLRAEERYENLELLKEAIARDAEQARVYFEGRGEL